MMDRWGLSHTISLLARSDDSEVVATLLVALWLLQRDFGVRKMLRRKTKMPLDATHHTTAKKGLKVGNP